MSSFTCLACSVLFKDADMQRAHFTTDWHRYNLKRKVSELPPVTAIEFQSRVCQARNADQELQRDESLFCKACKKFFKTNNSHENHLNGKKHKDSVKLFLENHLNDDDNEKAPIAVPASEIIEQRQKTIETEAMDVESVDSDEWDDDTENPIVKSNCIFCDHHSRNMVKNLKHMALAHSFFIPDAEYCCDVEGLLMYLAEKVCRDFICLWCNEKGRSFYSVLAVRQHMIEKGHCKMNFEAAALAEYVDFYDYSSSYPDHDETKDIDAEIETPVLDGDDYQLVLPSGSIIGHRSLMRYYKQRINPNRAVVVKKSDKKLHHLMAHYRALGMKPVQQELIARNARDLHMMKRTQAKLYMQLGNKANKLQKHFREQVNF